MKNMKLASRANSLYQRGEEEWRRGRMWHAFRLLLAAAKLGMAPAFGTVAQFYDRGEGVKADEAAALYWYRKAYRNGEASAANNIGCIWRDRRQLKRAAQWFERAVKLGDADANLNIAKLYLAEKGAVTRAVRFLRKLQDSRTATEGGRQEARRLLRSLER